MEDKATTAKITADKAVADKQATLARECRPWCAIVRMSVGWRLRACVACTRSVVTRLVFMLTRYFRDGPGEKDLADENKKIIGQKADCEAKIHKLEAEVGNLKIQVGATEQKVVAASAAKETAVKDKVNFWTV